MRIAPLASSLILLSAIFLHLRGQSVHAVRIDQQDGLSSQYIWDINQDDDGVIWLLTFNGLNKYSSNRITSLQQTPDGVSLPNHRWSRIFKTNHRLWLTGLNSDNDFVLLFHEADKWGQINLPLQLGRVGYNVDIALWNEDEPAIAYSTSDSLYISLDQGTSWTIASIPSELGHVRRIDLESQQILLFSNKGVFTYSFDKGFQEKIWNKKISLEWGGEHPVAIFNLKDGRTVFKFKDEIQVFKGEKLLSKSPVTRINTNNFYVDRYKWSDDIDKPIFLFNARLYTLNNDHTVREIWAPLLPKFGWINNLFIDRQGLIWVATDRGVYKFNNLAVEYYNQTDGLSDTEVTAISKFGDDALLLGTNNGVQVFSNGHFGETYLTRIQNQLHRVQQIEEYKGHYYAASTHAGVLKISPDFQVEKIFDSLVYSIVEYNDRLFFYADEEQLYSTDGINLRKEQDISAIKGAYIRKLIVTPQNELWSLGKEGIYNISGGNWIMNESQNYSLKLIDVFDVYFINDTEFLAASFEGLFTYNLSTKSIEMTRFGKDAIPFPVYAINKTNEYLWFSTDRGVFHTEDGEHLIPLSQEEGFRGADVNRGAFLEDVDGKLYVGSEFGLNVIDPSFMRKSVAPPIVRISRFEDLTNQKDLSLSSLNVLSTNTHYHIEYAIAGFYEPSTLQLRYRLGENQEWFYPSSSEERSVYLHNLQEGEYQFQIQAKERKSEWSAIASSPVFVVKAPLYRSPWFYLMAVILLLIPIYLAMRVLWLRSREIELNQKVREHTAKLRESQIRLQKQNKDLLKMNESLEQFTSLVSHDLKSPLNSSIGLMDLMNESYSKAELLKLNRMIQKQLINMRDFVYELIEISRNANQDLDEDELDLHTMIMEIFEQCEQDPQLPKIDLRLYIQEQLPLKNDQARVKVLLQNLIVNAVKYSNPKVDKPFCEVRIDVMENEAIIEVKDNGKGIAKNQQEKIFEMFYRPEQSISGSGLGLYLVQQVVDKLNGKIQLHSELDEGSTFFVSIPNKIGNHTTNRSRLGGTG